MLAKGLQTDDASNGEGFTPLAFSAQDGLKLGGRVYGAHRPGLLPVVCLPGLTRNARDFHELALLLSRDAERPRLVVSLDYRGRGSSAPDRDWRNYTVATEMQDVLAALAVTGIERAAFIGTSRGGLIAMALSAARPAALGAVILNDIGPVIDGAGLAQIRSYLNGAPRPADWQEAVQIQKAIHQAAFPALDEADWMRMARAIYRPARRKGLEPDFDPALVRTLRDIDLGRPLPALWHQFEGLTRIPVLAIRGGNSSLLSAETLKRMAERHPGLVPLTVSGQGHAPMLETAGIPERIAAFLARADRPAG